MSRTVVVYVIAAVAVLVLLAGGFYLATQGQPPATSTNNSQVTPTATPTPLGASPTATPSPASTKAASEVKEFTISGQGFAFSPSTISVHKGDTVKLTFTSKSNGPHNLVLSAFNARTNLLANGQSQSIQFVADKAGSFEFHCEPHRSMGMTGTLVVAD